MKDRPVSERIWAYISQGDGCWPWVGFVDASGYGKLNIRCDDGRHRPRRAHRIVYETLVGPIPEGMELDHTCHSQDPRCLGGPACPHRRCVRPDHLEPVARAENQRRALDTIAAANRRRAAVITHCPQGHPYAGDNLSFYPYGGKRCRTCGRERARAYSARMRGTV